VKQSIRHPEIIEKMGKIIRQIAVEKYDVHKVNAVILKTTATNCTNEHE
jgi:hypothetical protein